MDLLFEQLDTVREKWQQFIDSESTLKKVTSGWPSNIPSPSAKVATTASTGSNPPLYSGTQSDFEAIDAAIANANRILDEFVSSVEAMDSTFSALEPSLPTLKKVDFAEYTVLDAAAQVVPSISNQSYAAREAWKQGMGVFMPGYRKAKLEVIDNTARLQQK